MTAFVSNPAQSSKFKETSVWQSYSMAYINYGAANEYYGMNTDIPTFKPHIWKPVWFHLNTAWDAILQVNYVSPTVNASGFSATHLNLLKANCAGWVMPVLQWFNIGDGLFKWKTLVWNSTYRATAISFLVDFCVNNGCYGIEIDFEPTVSSGGYIATYDDMQNKYLFLTELCTAMHAVGKKVASAVPAISNNQSTYEMIDYVAINNTGLDHVIIMNYDHHYPFVNSVSVIDRYVDTCEFAKKTFQDLSKISMGIASYGASGTYNAATPNSFHNGTTNTFAALPWYATRKRNSKFLTLGGNTFRGWYDLSWLDTTTIYSIPDTKTLNEFRRISDGFGFWSVSVWSLAGNPWFSGKAEPAWWSL